MQIHINAARVNAGMSQEELAHKMGVSRQTIIMWENNKREMSTAQLFMFCHLTGFSADDIILPKKSTKSRRIGRQP